VNLIYVADPMCSWCYGFGKSMQAVLDEIPSATLSIVMGGLRPYTQQPLTDSKRTEILEHWRHVHEASGQPFSLAPNTAMHAPGFIYDTEPACRAVLTVREQWPQRAWPYLKAIQRAFYADAQNITQPAELASIAQSVGVERDAFANLFASEAMRALTRQDFAQVQAWGISGFPALIAEHQNQLHMISAGYTSAKVLLERLRALET
jgi:putative protein-disulfide isomerase